MSDTTKKTLTISLEEPVTHGEKTYEELTFRRRKAKDLAKMDAFKGQMQKHMALLASMAGVPYQVIEELDGDDFDRVAEETVALMGKSAQKALAETQSQAETEEASFE